MDFLCILKIEDAHGDLIGRAAQAILDGLPVVHKMAKIMAN
jgi:hypothetical protein